MARIGGGGVIDDDRRWGGMISGPWRPGGHGDP